MVQHLSVSNSQSPLEEIEFITRIQLLTIQASNDFADELYKHSSMQLESHLLHSL